MLCSPVRPSLWNDSRAILLMLDNNSEMKKHWIKWAEKRIYSICCIVKTLDLIPNHIEVTYSWKQQSKNMRSRGSLKRWNNRGRVEGSTNVVVSLRDVNKPVNTLTTTSERFEAGWHMRPCIRPDRLLHLPPRAPPLFCSLTYPTKWLL